MLKKISIGAIMATFLVGCTSDPYTGTQKMSNTAGGAFIGATVGALGGLAIGGGRGDAALIGAGIGALTGGAVGAYMDNQEAELRAQLRSTGVSVIRNGNQIILNMPSNITFNTDQDAVRSQFYPTLNSVAIVLRKFHRSLVDVYGHTDSTGSAGYNQQLSQRRAASVTDYLESQGLDPRRFAVVGYGSDHPIASNSTISGRAQNRRVEIRISPFSGG